MKIQCHCKNYNDTQVLKLYDERFTVPETYFHPEIIFDNNRTTASSVCNNAPFKKSY